jgi:hypothetical protein
MLITQNQIAKGEYVPLKEGTMVMKGVLGGSVVLEHIRGNCYLIYNVKDYVKGFALHNPKTNYFKPYPPKTLWKLFL